MFFSCPPKVEGLATPLVFVIMLLGYVFLLSYEYADEVCLYMTVI